MPLSGGTAGAHDDAMHQGSAKRDVVDGLAGLDSSGFLLAKGEGMKIPCNIAGNILIRDRNSFEDACRIHRIGANNYGVYINVASIWSQIQTDSMKDVVSGIAALDAGGAVLALGSEVKLTRDGSENIEVVERTSGDIVYRWTRIGANDYVCRINCGGVACIMQNDSMKDIAGGIAGLDANVQLDVLQMRPCVEEYSNHLGAVDNFTETAVSGTGSATADAANHEMDFATGATAGSTAIFRSKKTWTLGTKPIIANFIVSAKPSFVVNLQDEFVVGLSSVHNPQYGGFNHCAAFVSYSRVGGVNHMTWTSNASARTENTQTFSNGDLLTIVATTSQVVFLINGVVVQVHTTNLPAGAVHLWTSLNNVGDANNRTASIDLISVKA